MEWVTGNESLLAGTRGGSDRNRLTDRQTVTVTDNNFETHRTDLDNLMTVFLND